jgi:hypothetical protein
MLPFEHCGGYSNILVYALAICEHDFGHARSLLPMMIRTGYLGEGMERIHS